MPSVVPETHVVKFPTYKNIPQTNIDNLDDEYIIIELWKGDILEEKVKIKKPGSHDIFELYKKLIDYFTTNNGLTYKY